MGLCEVFECLSKFQKNFVEKSFSKFHFVPIWNSIKTQPLSTNTRISLNQVIHPKRKGGGAGSCGQVNCTLEFPLQRWIYNYTSQSSFAFFISKQTFDSHTLRRPVHFCVAFWSVVVHV